MTLTPKQRQAGLAAAYHLQRTVSFVADPERYVEAIGGAVMGAALLPGEWIDQAIKGLANKGPAK